MLHAGAKVVTPAGERYMAEVRAVLMDAFAAVGKRQNAGEPLDPFIRAALMLRRGPGGNVVLTPARGDAITIQRADLPELAAWLVAAAIVEGGA